MGTFWRLVESTSLKFECAHDENRRPFYWKRRAERQREGKSAEKEGKKTKHSKKGKACAFEREENVVIVLF